jgi:pectate lyase
MNEYFEYMTGYAIQMGGVSTMIALHSYLVYAYQQQIFIDEIQVYSRRHIQLSSTRAHSRGQPSIFCFALFHWTSYTPPPLFQKKRRKKMAINRVLVLI